MIQTISKEELREKIEKDEPFHLVDVRDTPDFEKEHIVGAVHLLIPEMTPENLASRFPKNDVIITYSEDRSCPAKRIAAQKFYEAGFPRVFAYEGSWKEWKQAGYPVETG